jgi:hypothetical protein
LAALENGIADRRGLKFHVAFAIVHLVNLLRALPLLATILLSSGCESYKSETYTRLRASNERDEVIAEWVARGRIVPLGRGGFRITAIERTPAPPHSATTRYPDGWRTSVQGAHIWHWPCPKPAWLAELEGDLDLPADATLQ